MKLDALTITTRMNEALMAGLARFGKGAGVTPFPIQVPIREMDHGLIFEMSGLVGLNRPK